MTLKEMVEMKLGEQAEGEAYWITRVPGGWIYNTNTHVVFVPLPLGVQRIQGVDW